MTLAAGSKEILERAVVYDTVEAAVLDMNKVYATTARVRDERREVRVMASERKTKKLWVASEILLESIVAMRNIVYGYSIRCNMVSDLSSGPVGR